MDYKSFSIPTSSPEDFICYTNYAGTISIAQYIGPGGDVNIPGTINGRPVESIDGWAFCSCDGLTSVRIGNNIKFIGNYAFSGCTNLTDVTISDGVTTIVGFAFTGCTSLSHVSLPESVTFIGEGVFRACNGLTAITVDVNNTAYCSVDGVLFNKEQTRLVQYPVGKNDSSYTIPDGVTDILMYAFDTCNNLTHVTLPASVTNIGVRAFGGSDSLTGVYFWGDAPVLPEDPNPILPSPESEMVLAALPPWVSPFEDSPNVIVYYLRGTTGWDTTYGERPTALWGPRMEVTAGTSGVSTNQFGFNIVWMSGQEIVVEANDSLTNSTWQPILTNMLSTDTLYFSDEQWTNYPARFYRITMP
jgi:hypothetical protein